MNTNGLLECPECGSTTFYVEWAGGMLQFSIDSDGRAVDLSPEAAGFALTPETVVYCTNCPWYGPVRELERPA